MAIEYLRYQNPWWSDPLLIESDDNVKVFESSNCKWFPPLDIDLKKNIIYSLRGPRQVGKTTYIKILIRSILRGGVDPKNVLYLHSEIFANWRELLESLNYYLRNIRRGRAYIMVDEISAVEGWPRALKYLYDIGMLRNNFVLVCGSHAMDVMRGIELLPGRRGEYEETPDYVLMPMSFYEYVKTVKPKIVSEIEEEIDVSSIEAAFESLYSFHTDLRGLLENYLVGGGFPHAQNHLLSHGTIRKRFYDDFIAYVKGDAHKEKISIIAMLQTARRIIETLSSPVSWRSLSHGTDYNYETIQKVAEFLRAAFVVEILYQPKPHRRVIMPDFRRDKKIYFIDPFILYSFDIWTTGAQYPLNIVERWLRERELKGKLIEGIILRHLLELTRGKKFSEEPLTKIFYARKNNREIDFIVTGRETLLIESKLKRKSELYIPFGLSRNKKTHILMSTEDELEKRENILIVPLPELLLLLSHPHLRSKL